LNLLSEAPTTAVTLTVAPDTTGITKAVNDFVSAYNSAIKSINSQFTVDASSSAGPLAGNSALRSLQSSLLSDVTFSVTGNNGIVNLASVGIDMADDGTLSVDNTKLSAAVSGNFPAVQNFFQSAAADGFAKHLNDNLSGLVSPSSGLLAININENTSNQKMLTKTISDFEDRLTARRQLLTTQYAQVDAMLRQYPLTIQQLQAQLNITSTSK
jgi:flagellar hook-associated protein 2